MVFSRHTSRFFLAAALAAGLALPAAAQDKAAQPGPGEGLRLVVGIVDMGELLTEAAAAKDIRAQVEKKRSAFQQEIQAEEKELREANQELARQRTLLAPDAFKEERRKFEERFVGAQRRMQERKQELDQAYNAAMDEVREALKDVITAFVQKNGITLLLRKEQTVFASKEMDVTPLLVSGLDQRLPSVDVFKDGAAAAKKK